MVLLGIWRGNGGARYIFWKLTRIHLLHSNYHAHRVTSIPHCAHIVLVSSRTSPSPRLLSSQKENAAELAVMKEKLLSLIGDRAFKRRSWKSISMELRTHPDFVVMIAIAGRSSDRCIQSCLGSNIEKRERKRYVRWIKTKTNEIGRKWLTEKKTRKVTIKVDENERKQIGEKNITVDPADPRKQAWCHTDGY